MFISRVSISSFVRLSISRTIKAKSNRPLCLTIQQKALMRGKLAFGTAFLTFISSLRCPIQMVGWSGEAKIKVDTSCHIREVCLWCISPYTQTRLKEVHILLGYSTCYSELFEQLLHRSTKARGHQRAHRLELCSSGCSQAGEITKRRTAEAPAWAPAVPTDQTHWPLGAIEAGALACKSAWWNPTCVVVMSLERTHTQLPDYNVFSIQKRTMRAPFFCVATGIAFGCAG
jgi:hypothetical protein